MSDKQRYKYQGGPVPKHLPQPGSLRFYPDPEVYPQSILEGFQLWPELYREGDQWCFRDVVPAKCSGREAIRVDDTFEEVVTILGRPLNIKSHQVSLSSRAQSSEATTLLYSKSIWIALLEGGVNTIVLTEDGEASIGMQFVFVDRG